MRGFKNQNVQENSFIRRLAVSKGSVHGVYIGATAAGNDLEWNDGSKWDYENFYPGELLLTSEINSGKSNHFYTIFKDFRNRGLATALRWTLL